MAESPRTSMSNEDSEIIEHLMGAIREIAADLAAIKVIFDAHTHNGDGAQAGSYYTSPPRSNAATVTSGTASAFATPTLVPPHF